MPSSPLLAGIDIGGTKVRCGVAAVSDPQCTLVCRTASSPAGESPERFVAFLAREVGACLRAVGGGKLVGVGCAAPGITDVSAGLVHHAVNLGWTEAPLKALLEQHLGVPATIENDVNAAAMAEYTFGAGKAARSLVYLTVSTGVAVGIVVEDRLVRGCHHAAGEIGFFLPDPVHINQDWGDNGCLELTAAGVGLARAWAARNGGDGAPTTAVEVFQKARDGDALALALVERAANYLSQAVVALGAILDPEVIVLGGSIAQNEPWIRDRLNEVVEATLPYPMEILPAQLGGDAPLLGGLALAARRTRATDTG